MLETIVAVATTANMNGRLRAEGWASLFNAPADPSRNVSFLEPRSANSPTLLNCNLQGEDLVEVAEEWKNALVRFFVGKRPHYLAVRASLSKAWKSKACIEFEALHNGFFMFKFKSFEDRQRILEEGPWFVGGHPLVLRRWSEELKFQKELKSIPIWIKFPNLKLTCRSSRAISKLASCVGTPLCMDKFTALGKCLAYARVLVEVSIDATLPDSIMVGCRGQVFEQAIEYAWKPKACQTCQTFNHNQRNCPK